MARRKLPVPAPDNTAEPSGANAAMEKAVGHEAFDRLARLAASSLRVPVCLISVIDPQWQRVEGAAGLASMTAVQRNIPNPETPCRIVKEQAEPLVIPDIRHCAPFAAMPVVQSMGIAGYLGIPLLDAENVVIGTICAIDRQPRHWSEAEIHCLGDMAALASDQLHLRAKIGQMQVLQQALDIRNHWFEQTITHIAHGLCFFGPDERLQVANRQYAEIYHLDPRDIQPGISIHDVMAHRAARGTDPVMSAEDYQHWRRNFCLAPHEPELVKLRDGRTIRIFINRLLDGGWVGIHEDVTSQLEGEEKIRQREAQYKLLATHSGDVIILRERNGRRLYCSPAIEALTGYTVAEAMLTPIEEWVHPDDLASLMAAMRSLSNSHPRTSVVHRMKRKNGSYLWVEGTLALVEQPGGESQVVCNIRDVTRRKKAESEYRDLFEHCIVGVYRKDLGHRLIQVNPALVGMAGHADASQMIQDGMDCWYVDPNRTAEIRRALDTEGHVRNMQSAVISQRTGDVMWISETAWIVTSEEGAPLYVEGMVMDITSSIAAQHRLRDLAERDQLTGLANRTKLRDALEKAAVAARNNEAGPALIYLDLDRFKTVNDSFGHAAGDELLVQIGHRIRDIIGDQGLIARMGGDEFAILLTAPDRIASIDSLAIRLITSINQVVQLANGNRATVGASIGIASWHPDDTGIDQIKRRADMAMYHAKRDGRNAFRHYSNSLEQQLQMRQQIETGLREAVAKDQFEVHFQPILDLVRKRLSGFEALVRWRHADGSMISPASFIPIAEENGLIVPIGEIVMHRAMQAAATWPDGLRVAINASVMQLRHPDFLGTLMAGMARTGLAPERIEIEVTESALLDDSPTTLAVLQKLQMLGIRVALDDFGTGWSSLSYLNRHRFDRIKIDRSFVKGISDRRNEAIIRAITDLGGRIGTEITAEGVETDEQLMALHKIGCHEAQGFLFGRPMPPADALAFAQQHSRPQTQPRYLFGVR